MGSSRLLITYLVLLFLFANTRTISCSNEEDPMRERYKQWMAKYGRTYDKDAHQREKRFKIYTANVELIEAFNSINEGYKLTDNKFADLTNKEFREQYMGFRGHSNHGALLDVRPNQEHSERARELLEDVPPMMDWREEGAVTRVRDQGQCGSCWAFSAVAAIEGITHIKSGRLITLSEQELLDCDTTGLNQACFGGLMTSAFDFICQNGGLTSESDYPYQGYQDNCKTEKLKHHVVTIKGYRNVTENSEQSLLEAVAAQPVSVGIDAGSFAFQFYSKGVFTGPCDLELNHAVTIVGYGTDGEDKFWIVKNSWGADWGEEGYVRMRRELDGENSGLCGIAMLPSYPLI